MAMEYTNEAPISACIFRDEGEVSCAEDDSGKSGFHIVGYTGRIMKNFFFGNVAFDLKGLKFTKKKTPVLENHDRDSRIGFATKQSITDKDIVFNGEFLPNSKAQEMKADLQGGFPMEASIMVVPSVVERVEGGSSLKVNGHMLKGPGAVVRAGEIKEVSMCTFGADTNTSSQVLAAAAGTGDKIKFNILKEKSKMDEKMTMETFAASHPDLCQEIITKAIAEGEKAERDLFAELKAACGDDHELLIKCFEEGKTKEEALLACNEKLQAANSELSTKMEELKTSTDVKATENEVDPAQLEFSNENQATEKGIKVKATTPEGWKAQFEASEELQTEFGDVETYVAYMGADSKGLVRRG